MRQLYRQFCQNWEMVDDDDDDDCVFHRGQISLFDRGSMLASGLKLPISRIVRLIGYFWLALLELLNGFLMGVR